MTNPTYCLRTEKTLSEAGDVELEHCQILLLLLSAELIVPRQVWGILEGPIAISIYYSVS